MIDIAHQHFAEWQTERDQFELSWRSNESLMFMPLPADANQLKEKMWHVWQHAVSSVKRRAALAAQPEKKDVDTSG